MYNEHNTASTESFLQPLKPLFSVGTKRKGSLGQGSSGKVRLSLELPMESGNCALSQGLTGSGGCCWQWPCLVHPLLCPVSAAFGSRCSWIDPAGLGWVGLE